MQPTNGSRARRLLCALYALGVVIATPASAKKFDVVEATIEEFSALYAAGKVSSVEVTKAYLNRIEKQDAKGAKLNSVIVNPNALAEAEAADALRKRGILKGPLHGVPVIVKDSYAVKGMATTNGLAGWKALIATKDSFNVIQFRKAGAIILGKANMSTFAFSYDGLSEAWGPVLNPYNPNRTPGGSSSGTGAAIGGNMAMVGMGGETGGSIRVPADSQGLVGLKPSLGLVSVNGAVPLVPDRDVIGPIAKSVTDVALTLDVLAVKDPDDLYAPEYLWDPTPEMPERRPETYTAYLDDTALEGKTIGVLKPYIGKGDPALGVSNPIDPETEMLFDEARAVLEAQGATLVEVTPPAHTTYFIDQPAGEAWTSLGIPDAYGAFDAPSGILGNMAYYYDLFFRLYAPAPYTSLPAVGPITSPVPDFYSFYELLMSAYDIGNLRPHTDPLVQAYLAGIKLLRERDLEDWMAEEGIDAFVCPTMKIPAFLQGPGIDLSIYGDTLNARFESNILGLPAITVPMGFYDNGVPGTLQFIGDFYGEAEIIGYAYDYEQATMFREAPKMRKARRIRECPDGPNGRCKVVGPGA